MTEQATSSAVCVRQVSVFFTAKAGGLSQQPMQSMPHWVYNRKSLPQIKKSSSWTNMTKGPKRTAVIPAHIDAKKMPTGVWWDKSGAGKWMLKYKDPDAGKWRSKRLCGLNSSLAEIWQAYESHNALIVATFSTLSRDFQQTPIWRKLALSTQQDYLDCHTHITTRKISTGILGDLPLNKWTVGLG